MVLFSASLEVALDKLVLLWIQANANLLFFYAFYKRFFFHIEFLNDMIEEYSVTHNVL